MSPLIPSHRSTMVSGDAGPRGRGDAYDVSGRYFRQVIPTCRSAAVKNLDMGCSGLLLDLVVRVGCVGVDVVKKGCVLDGK